MANGSGRVLVTGSDIDQQELVRLQESGLSYELETRTLDRRAVYELVSGFDYYIYGGIEAADELDESDFRSLASRGLRLIAFAGKGVGDFLRVGPATEAGIVVTNTPGAVEPSVAEFTVFMMVALLRQALARSFNWTSNIKAFESPLATTFSLGRDLSDATVGIIGLGDIGYLVAKLLRRGYGSKVFYCSRTRKPAIEDELSIEFMPMTELLAHCDLVTIHLPVSEGTRRYVADIAFEDSSSPVMLVNSSSQKLIEAERMASLLSSGVVSAAAFDKVYTTKELLGTGLADYIPGRFVVTNHSANATRDAWRRMTAGAVDAVLSLASGETPRNVVSG